MSTAALALELPGARKAAMFLMGIGDQLSVDIIRQLAPDEIRRINGEISALDAVPPEQMLSVFKEFESMSASSRFFAKGGPESARRLIEQAMGKEKTQLLLDGEKSKEEKIEPVGPDGPFADVDPQELAEVLREENPQTLALILANMAPAQAGPLMASLQPEVRPQVALRIALMDRISPDVFNRIAQAIRARLKASRQITRSNGDKALAAILNHMDGDLTDSLLTTLEVENQSTIAAVRGFMFVFEDIIDIDKEGIKVLLARVDRKALTLALKGTSDKIKQHFTQCMSSRSSEMLLEDMEALGPVRLRDVAGAQQQIVGTIRQLEKEGAIASSREAEVAMNMLCKVLDSEDLEVSAAPWRKKAAGAPPPPKLRNLSPGARGENAQLREQVEELTRELEIKTKEAWEQGIRAGDAAARKAMEDQMRSAMQGLAATVAEVSATRPETIRRAEADTVRLAIEIARRALHRELSLDPSALEALIKAAIVKLQNQEIYKVRVHPDQQQLLRKCLEQTGRGSAVEVLSDPGQPRGTVSFEISRGTLDASVDTQLREIENGLVDQLERRA